MPCYLGLGRIAKEEQLLLDEKKGHCVQCPPE
jgi:hypothetical protein